MENAYLTTHSQILKNLSADTNYYFIIHSEDQNGNILPLVRREFKADKANSKPTPILNGEKICKSQLNDLNPNCFKDPDEFVADYLSKNLKVCFWKLDKQSMCIKPVDAPKAPANAI